LGRLPYKEQLHWKQYNLQPRGAITKHRWKTDFMAEFAEPENDPVYYFHKAFDNLQEITKEKLRESLFLPLNQQEKYLYEIIRIPLTDEWKEFDEIIEALSKILPDSINSNLLKKTIKLKIDGKVIKGSLDLLQAFLERKTNTEESKLLLISFRRIQALRSTGAVHRKGGKFEKILKTFNYYGKSTQGVIRDILVSITKSFNRISQIINNN